MSNNRRSAGFTLIELIVAIVIIGVGIAGVMAAFSTGVRGSADALVEKQMLAIAEEMMEEIRLKPFAQAVPNTSFAPGNSMACGAGASRDTFNDVRDYSNYATTGICDALGDAVAGLEQYDVSVAVQVNAGVCPAGSMDITVTVARGGQTRTLSGQRADYGSCP